MTIKEREEKREKEKERISKTSISKLITFHVILGNEKILLSNKRYKI